MESYSYKNLEYFENTQTLVGTKKRRLVDEETGEIIYVDQITKRIYGQRQFWKVYLMDFLQVLGILDSKQIDVLIYILENTEPANNTFLGTYRKIAKEVNVSLDTTTKVMRKLQEKGFIKKIQNGAYQLSPTIMMKGNEHKKSLLLNYYDNREDKKDETD